MKNLKNLGKPTDILPNVKINPSMEALQPDLASGVAALIPDSLKKIRLFWQCAAEMFGSALLVLFGVGSVAMANATGSVADTAAFILFWGLGVSFAIYAVGSVSGAHLNPAVSLAFALLRPAQFPIYKLPCYWVAQLIGAMAGAGINWSIWHPYIQFNEDCEINPKTCLPRGQDIIGASSFGGNFPNPGVVDLRTLDISNFISHGQAFWVEAWGTGLFMALILAFTDSRQQLLPTKAAPLAIGFALATLVVLYAPITQGCFNPARDFGPRLVAHSLGYKDLALPGYDTQWWVYFIAPLIGAPLGGVVYEVFMASGLESGDIELGAAKIQVAKGQNASYRPRQEAEAEPDMDVA